MGPHDFVGTSRGFDADLTVLTLFFSVILRTKYFDCLALLADSISRPLSQVTRHDRTPGGGKAYRYT